MQTGQEMLTGKHNTGWIGRAVMAAAVTVLCTPAVWALGQRSGASAPRSAPAQGRSGPAYRTGPAYRPASPRNQARPDLRPQGRPQANTPQRPPFGYPGTSNAGPSFSLPANPGYAQPGQAPPGHLGDWLNQHRNLPVQEQERTLRGDPSFRRLAPSDQQRVVQQLHQVNQLPEEQRQRRLARAEALEHLSPQERMQVNLSARRWAAQPGDRQVMMRNAFRDLRAVPLDQRQTVLNSARYQGVFSPEERGILSDMLRVEPYEPAR